MTSRNTSMTSSKKDKMAVAQQASSTMGGGYQNHAGINMTGGHHNHAGINMTGGHHNHAGVTKSHSVSTMSSRKDSANKKDNKHFYPRGHHHTSSDNKKLLTVTPTSAGGRTVTVQRQRSCVANLYSSHGPPSHSATMPAATTLQRPKPAMQLYRPPTLRVSDDLAISNASYSYDVSDSSFCSFKPGLNINAKEFVSLSTNGAGLQHNNQSHGQGSVLKHSKSSSQVGGRHHSKLGGTSKTIGGGGGGGREGRNSGASPPLRVHFTDDAITYDPSNKAGMTPPNSSHYLLTTTAPTTVPTTLPLTIKRSKSLGSAADLQRLGHHQDSDSSDPASSAIKDLSPFPEDIVIKLQQVLQDPDSSGSRSHMEVVRLLFDRLVQGTRYAEPAARYCIAVIEKEKSGETFLETLLNTCQEYYQERDMLLRTVTTVPASTRWLSYMTFLHEMYTQVKRRLRRSADSPRMLLLTLLAECCVTSLHDLATTGATSAQVECLFFILTGIGRDCEVLLAGTMTRIMAAARDALLTAARTPPVRKTLLQLIEMNAANWHLPAPAVMYYHPGIGGK